MLRLGTLTGVAKVKLLERAQCVHGAVSVPAVLARCSGRGRLQSLQGPYIICASHLSPVKGTGLTGMCPYCLAQVRNQQ